MSSLFQARPKGIRHGPGFHPPGLRGVPPAAARAAGAHGGGAGAAAQRLAASTGVQEPEASGRVSGGAGK